MMFGGNGYPLADESSPFRDVMKAVDDTRDTILPVGLVKLVPSCLSLVPDTAPLALLIALPCTVNTLLHCIFFANEYVLLGIPDFLCPAFPIYA